MGNDGIGGGRDGATGGRTSSSGGSTRGGHVTAVLFALILVRHVVA